jgi:hypothetical protein
MDTVGVAEMTNPHQPIIKGDRKAALLPCNRLRQRIGSG